MADDLKGRTDYEEDIWKAAIEAASTSSADHLLRLKWEVEQARRKEWEKKQDDQLFQLKEKQDSTATKVDRVYTGIKVLCWIVTVAIAVAGFFIK